MQHLIDSLNCIKNNIKEDSYSHFKFVACLKTALVENGFTVADAEIIALAMPFTCAGLGEDDDYIPLIADKLAELASEVHTVLNVNYVYKNHQSKTDFIIKTLHESLRVASIDRY